MGYDEDEPRVPAQQRKHGNGTGELPGLGSRAGVQHDRHVPWSNENNQCTRCSSKTCLFNQSMQS